MNRRFAVLLTVFFTIMFFLILKLVNLQLLNGWKNLDEVETSMMHLERIPPIRGRIIARDGRIIAWSEEIDGKLGRRYECPESLSHVVGYTDSDGKGVMGIEKEYDPVLRGRDGLLLYQVNSRGEKITDDLVTPPMPGYDVVLTIDLDLQMRLENLLRKTGKPSCGLIINPKNGEILAMASLPSFDLNIMRNMSESEWEQLKNAKDSPLLNRVISSSYLPGSIIKPFTALTALYFGYDPKKEIKCTGKLVIEGESGRVYEYKDWIRYGHGNVDMVKALRVSCNVYFYNLGIDLGIDKLHHLASKIGLMNKTGVDLPEERTGIYPSVEWKKRRYNDLWYLGDTILTAIGQGYISLTPIQIARLYTIIANKGETPRLHLLKEIRNPITGEMVKEYEEGSEKVIDLPEDSWKILYEGLVEVIKFKGENIADRGTAYEAFKGFRYDVAGKTGTSEIGGGELNSWFVGFTPVDDPKFLILILVEKGGYGGHTAAPIARKMMEYYYRRKSKKF
ncbi:MAG: hypothetical protein DRP30_04000 [Thermotoga sp.]|nr:MAG: hypothetical protein DRP30_04000 [Thermotoga sp.]